MSRYYDKQGKPMELLEWAQKFEDWEYKQIAKISLANGYRVSTVWLGANHAFDPDSAPLIFETMVFGDQLTEEDCERYSTEAEAVTGHAAMVKKWEAK